MGTRCRFLKWRSSCFVATDSALYHHHCQHRTHQRYRRLHTNSPTMIQFFVVLIIPMSLMISPCLGQRISGNGLEDGGRTMARGRERNVPCLPGQYLDIVRSPFQKLIPTFNSDSLTIQLRTDLRIQMGPSDPSLVPFLQSYYATALRQIVTAGKFSSQEEKLATTAMFLYFSTEYTRFLVKIGVPLSCISYFLGVTDPQVMLQLQQLTKTLQKRYLSQNDAEGFRCLFEDSLTGPEVMDRLRISSNEQFSPTSYLQDTSRDAGACEKLILYMKDGSVLAKMPILNLDRKELRLPTVNTPIQLGQAEVPYQIGRFIATGLNCLDDASQKRNFTSKVVEWMKIEMVDQIVRTPVCLSGFGGILPFILSVQQFSENFKSDSSSNFQPDDYDYPVNLKDNRQSYPDMQKISDRERTASYVLESPPSNARSMGESYYQVTTAATPKAHHKPHDINHSSWLFTFFMLLILIIIILFACAVLLGVGPRECMRCLKNTGMHWKNEKRRSRRRLRPRYEKVQPESDTTEAISEKEETLVFSTPKIVEQPPSTPVISVTPSMEESIPCVKEKSEVSLGSNRKPKRKCGRRKRPIVEIHSSGRESIRLEITTDTECDDSVATVNIDEEDCDEEDCQDSSTANTCPMSELDYDDYTKSPVKNKPFKRGKRDLGTSFKSFAPDTDSIAFKHGGTSTATSSVNLSPKEKREIKQRYSGPNASAVEWQE